MRSTTTLTACLVLAMLPPLASAQTTERRVGGYEAALAGDAVVTAGWSSNGTVRVRQGSRLLATFGPPTRDTNHAVVTLAGSATTWAAGVKWLTIEDGEGGGTIERGELVAAGAVGGGPATTLMSCGSPGEADDPIAVAVAGRDVAWSGAACPGGDGVRFAAGGAGPARLLRDGMAVAMTPAHIAFHVSEPRRAPERIAVVDRATDQTRFVEAPTASGFALDESGLVAMVSNDDLGCSSSCRQSLRRVSDGTALVRTPTTIPGPGGARLAAGGGRVLAERARGNGVVAVDLATGALSYAGALGFNSDGTVPLAVDATTATFLTRACDGVLTVRTEETSPDPVGRLPRSPCPIRVLSRTVELRGRRADLRIRCPRGCATELYATFRGRAVATAAPRMRPGTTRTVPLSFETVRPFRGQRTATLVLRELTEERPLAAPNPPVRIRLRIG